MAFRQKNHGAQSNDVDFTVNKKLQNCKSESKLLYLQIFLSCAFDWNTLGFCLDRAAIRVMTSERRRQLLRFAFSTGKDRDASFGVFMDTLGRKSNMAVTNYFLSVCDRLFIRVLETATIEGERRGPREWLDRTVSGRSLCTGRLSEFLPLVL